MRKSLLISNILILATFICMAACSKATSLPYTYYQNYVVAKSSEAKSSEKWTSYLYYHLSKRAKKHTLVSKDFANNDNHVTLYVSLDSTLNHDYRIDRKRLEITLSAREEKTMVWLIYQFIAGIALEDARFDASDLPPAVIDPVSTSGTMAFEWRSIYSPSNADKDRLPITATHHVDYDWGLWGHNLHKAVGMKPEYMAMVDGEKNNEQYCFTSTTLFADLVEYIVDNFGYGTETEHTSITIMPLDNSLVCTCPSCSALGNTSRNATPAVTEMLASLARRFPNHKFFTTAYSTTKTPPTKPLPENAGVMISAMDIPMLADFQQTEGFKAFDTMLKEWKKQSPLIYVWEYCRNFDDYLTPYPCISHLRSRAIYYNKVGVRGIFVNGSGDDYATFDDLQTYLISAILVNPKADIDKLTRRFFQWYYPETAPLLTEYYLSLEDAARKGTVELPYYGGICDSEASFLDTDAFFAFWDELNERSKAIEGDERKRLNTLLTGLNFTRLELMRIQDHPDNTDVAEALAVMDEYKWTPSMSNYRETNGSMAEYINEWRTAIKEVKTNALQDAALDCSAPEADGMADLLTDGRYAFTSDYHVGWVISSAPSWTITIPAATVGEAIKKGTASLSLSFLQGPAWRIWLPQEIEVTQGERQIAIHRTPEKDQLTDRSKSRRSIIKLPLRKVDTTKPLAITIACSDKKRAQVAIDEIIIE